MQHFNYIRSSIKWLVFNGVLFIISSVSAVAYEPDTLFKSDEVIKIELRSDFSRIIGDRTEFQEYQDAELIYYTKDRKSVKIQVMIMARGNFRRNPENCDFPPLFINFKKSAVRNTIFESQDKLKLTTTCQEEEDLLEEYIIYKMYNNVTDMSLRVRLVEILYFDTGNNRKLFEKYSFFTEDPERAALRVDATVEKKAITPSELDRENFKKMSVYQYMIGNSDWQVSDGKNIIIMQPKGLSGKHYAVPYDFDFSVFVGAKYSIPKGLDEDMTTTRKVFKGLCYSNSEFIGVFDLYKKLRVSFESIIKKQKGLSIDAKDRLILFLNDFYTVIDNNEIAKQVFQAPCAKGVTGISGGK